MAVNRMLFEIVEMCGAGGATLHELISRISAQERARASGEVPGPDFRKKLEKALVWLVDEEFLSTHGVPPTYEASDEQVRAAPDDPELCAKSVRDC